MDLTPLTDRLDFDGTSDAEAFARGAPARWAVYLFADADDRPIQLLCVKNLRASLRRRLGGGEVVEAATVSRKVDYRQIVRRVHYRRVDSGFEADLVYLDAARASFPGSYQKLAGLRPAWFVHVDPASAFPRWIKSEEPTAGPGEWFGPLPSKDSAAGLVASLEDWFDLCRYHEILTKAPSGRACAYKEMGRCPAPCDGSVSMPQYRVQVEYSMSALIDPGDFIRQQQRRMQAAATELKFESAAKIRQFVDSLSSLGKGDLRYVRRLRDLRFLSLQAGATGRSARAFLITPGRVDAIGDLPDGPGSAPGLIREALLRAESAGAAPDSIGLERIGVVTHHLFSRKPSGVFLPLDTLDERTLAAGYRELQRQRQPDAAETLGDEGDEGVQRQLQAS